MRRIHTAHAASGFRHPRRRPHGGCGVCRARPMHATEAAVVRVGRADHLCDRVVVVTSPLQTFSIQHDGTGGRGKAVARRSPGARRRPCDGALAFHGARDYFFITDRRRSTHMIVHDELRSRPTHSPGPLGRTCGRNATAACPRHLARRWRQRLAGDGRRSRGVARRRLPHLPAPAGDE